MSLIPRECKRLAEVDFPIAAVSRHAAQEKSVRHGHPSTLHIWWARRPLASSRAILLALLLPDPCDPLCPPGFKDGARTALERGLTRVGPLDADLRKGLLEFIGEFASWNRSADSALISTSRALVKATGGEDKPVVVDPFAGGGSIPLEGLRLGCDVVATDLNPVAFVLLKTMLEDIQEHGSELSKLFVAAGRAVSDGVRARTADLYPIENDGSRPFAYLWARSVVCESPGCGAEIPLMRSFWLVRKTNRRLALRPILTMSLAGRPTVEFELYTPSDYEDIAAPTVSNANAICPCCKTVLAAPRVRAQLSKAHGGGDVIWDAEGRRAGGARMLAIVTTSPNHSGRQYRLPVAKDYEPVRKAWTRLHDGLSSASLAGISAIPDESIPRTELRRIALPIYGMAHFRDAFTSRQLVTLSSITHAIRNWSGERRFEVQRLLALSLDKTVDLNNSLAPWKADAECPVHKIARHDIGMSWDFVEAAPMSLASGSFASAYERTADSIGPSTVPTPSNATVMMADACDHPLPSASADVWFTDPPYYDSVPYAHLSDFFLVWARRALDPTGGQSLPPLSPKEEECVADRPHSSTPGAKTRDDFEKRISLAMSEGVRITKPDGVACVVFAHKTTEGWEALLSGMIRSGWKITASWPIVTELDTRLNARENASLAGSVHLVCRPRAQDAPIGDWTEVNRQLPARVRDWMERLGREGVHGADLVFSCIGPAMEIYSRFSKVVDAQDREIPLGGDPAADEPYKQGFLAKVWEVVGRLALEQVLSGVKDGPMSLEEDARLTALFLWTIQSNATATADDSSQPLGIAPEENEVGDDKPAGPRSGGYSLPHDVVRRFAQPLGIHLEAWEGRVIRTEKGVVRLLPVEDRTVQLFGQESPVVASSDWQGAGSQSGRQLSLFPEEIAVPVKKQGRRRGGQRTQLAANAQTMTGGERRRRTTLDRLHTAMLLQANGATSALQAFLEEEHGRGPDLERLANALAALYPSGSEERRLVEALALVFPR